MRSTREMIRDFNVAFGRPVNEVWTELTVEERVLIGSLLLEETVEYIYKGLGLRPTIQIDGAGNVQTDVYDCDDPVNPVECIDGLADVNVVAHFCAHWHGFNLDVATEIVNDSNMSKLGDDGKAIINGVTPGYCDSPCGDGPQAGFDSSKPIGKILKGPNYWEPTLALQQLIFEGNNR